MPFCHEVYIGINEEDYIMEPVLLNVVWVQQCGGFISWDKNSAWELLHAHLTHVHGDA